MIIDVSVAIIAVAFVILVVYLIVLMKTLRVTMGQVDQTLVEVRKQLSEMGGQAQKVMEHTNQIGLDLRHKVETFSPIFNAIAHAGEILEYKTSALKKEFLASSLDKNDFSNIDSEKKKLSQTQDVMTIAAILELAGIGMRLWQKLKKRR